MKNLSKIVALILILSSLAIDLFSEEERNSNQIVSKNLQHYLGIHKNKVTAKCATHEMMSYGLDGDAEDLNEPNELCPQLKGNCCGKGDIQRIKKFWEHDTRHQGYYNAAILKMNKYILGFGNQYKEIANQIINKSKDWILRGVIKNKKKPMLVPEEDADLNYSISYHPMCVKSATKIIEQDWYDKNKAEEFYKHMTTKMEFLQNARRGFYCMLCDAKAKEYILTRKSFIPHPFPRRIKYSRDFCEIIHNWTYKAVYFTYSGYNPFLKNLFRMLACVAKKKKINKNPQKVDKPERKPLSHYVQILREKPYENLPADNKKLYKNPLRLKRKFWINRCYNTNPTSFWFPLFCYNFCSNFNLVEFNSLLDGDLKPMEIIYNNLREYEFALQDPLESLFNEDVLQLKEHIQISFNYLGKAISFYYSRNPEFDFKNYTTDFSILYKGVNPMVLSDGSPLEFAYKHGGIFEIMLYIAMILLFW